MSLIVLKNRGYQEYKNIVRESPELIESQRATPEKFGKPAATEPKLRRISKRILKLATVTTCTTSLVVALYVAYEHREDLLWSESMHLVSPADLPPLEPLPKDVARAHEIVTNVNSVWKCEDGRFTNSPSTQGACEYMWNAKDEQKGRPDGSRFITPESQ